jgi:hypothetical protein
MSTTAMTGQLLEIDRTGGDDLNLTLLWDPETGSFFLEADDGQAEWRRDGEGES